AVPLRRRWAAEPPRRRRARRPHRGQARRRAARRRSSAGARAMDTVLVAQTRNAELHALGTGGQLAVLAWDQVTQYLRRTLSPAHALLFAEPNFDPERGTVDWYTEGAVA